MRRKLTRRMSILAAACLLAWSATALPANSGREGDFKPGEMVCKLLPGYSVDLLNDTYGTSVQGYQSETHCYLLITPPGADVESLAATISLLPEVIYCDPNYYVDAPEPFQRSQPFLDAELVGDYDNQAAATALRLPESHALATGAGVRVAVIDGGVNAAHPVFAAKADQVVFGWDFVDNDANATDEPGGPGSGHGTFIAGVIHLTAPQAQIRAYRVLDTLGRGDGFDVAGAILRAAQDGCRVINLSLGLRGVHYAIDDAIKFVRSENVLVVAAIGNASTNDSALIPFPASQPYCLAVAAVDSLNRKADFSNYGDRVGVCAPGTNIYAPFLDSSFAWWDGTSFSAPFVSGQAALLISARPGITNVDVNDLILESTTSIDSLNPGLEGQLGHGLIGVVASLQRLTSTCGDADASGSVTVTDAIRILNYVFMAGPPPSPLAAGDVDCSGRVNIADAVAVINFIFVPGTPPPCTLCQ